VWAIDQRRHGQGQYASRDEIGDGTGKRRAPTTWRHGTNMTYVHVYAVYVVQDMESEDYEFYKGLDFLLEHKVTDLGYDLTFSTEIQEFGVTEVRDLIADGRNITVSTSSLLRVLPDPGSGFGYRIIFPRLGNNFWG
jgi:hypothetical protein